MIFEMVFNAPNAQGKGGGIASKLADRKFPFPVMYGPELAEREFFDTTVVFRRDDSTSDAFGPAQGVHRNARKLASRFLAAECLIYAKSTLPNAHVGDHEYLAEQIVDGVVVALEHWVSEEQAAIRFGEMRYLRPEELPAGNADARGFAGRVYRIKFSVGAGIYDRAFTGEGRPTGLVAGVRNRTEARLEGASTLDPPTVGCDSIDGS